MYFFACILRPAILRSLICNSHFKKQHIATSGLFQDYGELQKELDVLIQEVDEKKEKANSMKDLKAKEGALLDAGISFHDSSINFNTPFDQSTSTALHKKSGYQKIRLN